MAEEKKMVSENGKDLCVLCLEETQYNADDHIDDRKNYVEGSGQFCVECYEAVYDKK